MLPVQEMGHIPFIVRFPSIFCTIAKPAKQVSIKRPYSWWNKTEEIELEIVKAIVNTRVFIRCLV